MPTERNQAGAGRGQTPGLSRSHCLPFPRPFPPVWEVLDPRHPARPGAHPFPFPEGTPVTLNILLFPPAGGTSTKTGMFALPGLLSKESERAPKGDGVPGPPAVEGRWEHREAAKAFQAPSCTNQLRDQRSLGSIPFPPQASEACPSPGVDEMGQTGEEGEEQDWTPV